MLLRKLGHFLCAGPEKKIIFAMTGTLLLPQTRSNLDLKLQCKTSCNYVQKLQSKTVFLTVLANMCKNVQSNVLLGGDCFFPSGVVKLKVVAGFRANILQIISFTFCK